MSDAGHAAFRESAGVSPEDLAAADQQIRDAVTETTGEPFRGFVNVGNEPRARLSGLARELWDAENPTHEQMYPDELGGFDDEDGLDPEHQATPWWDADRLVAAAAEQLLGRSARTSRGAARQERRVVTQLVDDRVPFAELGSLTDRARLRDQVLADLAARRGDRSQGRGWSL